MLGTDVNGGKARENLVDHRAKTRRGRVEVVELWSCGFTGLSKVVKARPAGERKKAMLPNGNAWPKGDAAQSGRRL